MDNQLLTELEDVLQYLWDDLEDANDTDSLAGGLVAAMLALARELVNAQEE